MELKHFDTLFMGIVASNLNIQQNFKREVIDTLNQTEIFDWLKIHLLSR